MPTCIVNIILLTDDDFTPPLPCTVQGVRARHIATVLKSAVGDVLKVGLLNGKLGSAQVLQIISSGNHISVQLGNMQWDQVAPAPLPITLLLALPRPRMLGRLLRDITSLGVKNIHLFHSSKVEKSFWQTPELMPDSVHERLLDGLTQARDTLLPSVHLHRQWQTVLRDVLPDLFKTHTGILADPFSPQATPALTAHKPVALVIGPEGGFTAAEREQLLATGCQPMWLGSRILRVETAAHNAIGRLSAMMELPSS